MRFAVSFLLRRIKTLIHFALTVRVSLALQMIVVRIVMISLMRDGKRYEKLASVTEEEGKKPKSSSSSSFSDFSLPSVMPVPLSSMLTSSCNVAVATTNPTSTAVCTTIYIQ